MENKVEADMTNTEVILNQALELPSQERALIAHQLLSLEMEDAEAESEFDEATTREILRRAEEVSTGKVVGIPWRESVERIRRRLAQGRET